LLRDILADRRDLAIKFGFGRELIQHRR
jgi:hypothetical protein